MHGHITKFRDDIGFGVIRGEDGRTYRFSQCQVQNPNGKLVGHDVDFLIESRAARDIVLMHGSPWTAFGAPKRR
jgi:hypothetical protein